MLCPVFPRDGSGKDAWGKILKVYAYRRAKNKKIGPPPYTCVMAFQSKNG